MPSSTITERQATPRVEGRLVKRRDGGWSLVIDECPFCGEAHTHGAPHGPDTREATRVSHCHLVKSQTYVITVGGLAA